MLRSISNWPIRLFSSHLCYRFGGVGGTFFILTAYEPRLGLHSVGSESQRKDDMRSGYL